MTAPDLLPQAGTALCAAPGCRRGTSMGKLCLDHYVKISRTLDDLATDLTASSDVKIGGWSTGATSGGPLKSEKDPIDFRFLDAQRQSPPILEAWAIWLCSQRPNLTRGGGPVADRTLITHELDWLIGRDEVTALWCQLRGLWHSLRGHPHRVCEDCGGPVWSEPGAGWCQWCTRAWTGSELLKLGRPGAAA